MLAIETAKAAIGTQWTKKVIIEKHNSSEAEEEHLVRFGKTVTFFCNGYVEKKIVDTW